MKVCLYCRVSTKGQDVEFQAAEMKKYAKSKGWEVVWTLQDTESGTLDLKDRVDFNKLLYTVKGGKDPKLRYNFMDKCDAVLIYKLDRLTRSWNNAAIVESAFANSKWNLLCSSDSDLDLQSAEGRFKFRLMMAISVREVEVTKERMMPKVRAAQLAGKYKGRKKGSKNKPKTRREPSKSIRVSFPKKEKLELGHSIFYKDTPTVLQKAKKYLNDNKELMERLSKD